MEKSNEAFNNTRFFFPSKIHFAVMNILLFIYDIKY